MEMGSRDRNRHFLRPARLSDATQDQEGTPIFERREVAKLLAMWGRFSADGLVPSLDDLKLFLGADGWDRRFLVAQDPDPSSSVLLTCGSGLAEILGDAIKGRTLRDLVWDGCRPLLDACIESARRRRPITAEGTLRNQANLALQFRAVVLPVGGGRDSIPYLFGTVGWIAAAGAQTEANQF